MGASKRMMLAKAIKDARAAKAGASSVAAADPIPPSTLPLPPPTPTEAPLSSSSPSPLALRRFRLLALLCPLPPFLWPWPYRRPQPPSTEGNGFWRSYPTMRTRMAWHPSRGGNLQGFPSYRRRRPRERILSGTTLPALLLFPPQPSKRIWVKAPSLLHPRHRQRSLRLLPPSLPPPILSPSLLQSCI